MSSPLFLANNFIRRALREDISLSPMKLQKLIYFTYRDFLKETGKPLFSERFGTWDYGPVVESVYHEFKGFGAQSINRFSRDAKGDVYALTGDGALDEVIDAVWKKFKSFTGIELSEMTHKQGTAWYKAWCAGNPFLKDEDIAVE